MRKIRVAVSWVVMVLVLYIFIVRGPLAVKLSEPLLAMQFVPAVMKILAGVGGFAVAGCVIVLALTLVFGRVYCACLCPLGIFQDLLFFVRNLVAQRVKPLRKAARMKPAADYAKLRYAILIATIFFAALGSVALLDLLDPYSLFGRFATGVLSPPVSWSRSFLAGILEQHDIYTLSEPRVYVIVRPVLAISGTFFLGLVLLVLWRGRIYCNTVCPVGTLLGLLSNVAPVRIRINKESCNGCGLCELKCRTGCIDTKADEPIDVTRCVACFDCLSVCRKDAITYNAKIAVAVEGRRHFIAGSATVAAGVLGLPLRAVAAKALPPHDAPIMPPGAVSVEHLSSKCTACHLCVSVCPQQVIRPALAEYGMRGLMQPVLNLDEAECDYECNVCGQVCPAGAIKPLALKDKKRVRIGKVWLHKGRCIVYQENQDCGACAEVCPTHAVYTIEDNNILYPETRIAPCIGCGACQHICPVLPKAITVEPLAVQETADPPFKEEPKPKSQPPVNTPKPEANTEDFPF